MTPDKKTYRIFDVNLNRAREGMRVIEETLRFVLNDEKHYKKIRELRHNLSSAVSGFHEVLLSARNSRDDFGKKNKEKRYKNIDSLFLANFKRVTESLRVLEEYSRVIRKGLSCKDFKYLRFKVYNLEKEVYIWLKKKNLLKKIKSEEFTV